VPEAEWAADELQEMLDEMSHDAAIYSKSHVGCKCKLVNPVTKETEE
jgi:hypothetical protein